MRRKQVTQKDPLRGQLESIVSNYRSAAFLPIPSLESQQIQSLEENHRWVNEDISKLPYVV